MLGLFGQQVAKRVDNLFACGVYQYGKDGVSMVSGIVFTQRSLLEVNTGLGFAWFQRVGPKDNSRLKFCSFFNKMTAESLPVSVEE